MGISFDLVQRLNLVVWEPRGQESGFRAMYKGEIRNDFEKIAHY
jgi:hypothetical protein